MAEDRLFALLHDDRPACTRARVMRSADLEYFKLAVEAGSLARAAMIRGMRLSTFARAIDRLEDELASPRGAKPHRHSFDGSRERDNLESFFFS
ncbi:LysR family transcriptional regulator [Nguyenibacter vanlangensis]|uniref:LysR family transcriptional regulator n=1 Tax=Nguyenibacter vanlangensis TaxID=1216886 RepID=A0ABZ3D9V5_9PROT